MLGSNYVCYPLFLQPSQELFKTVRFRIGWIDYEYIILYDDEFVKQYIVFNVGLYEMLGLR